MIDRLQRLNSLPAPDAITELLSCCGSTKWAELMAGQRPFRELQDLYERTDVTFEELSDDDWLEAFRSHPKIGERKAERATGEEARRWSEQEQGGTRDAERETLAELAELNREYEAKFGYIFIVCATGKSAEEMLGILRARTNNDPEIELRVASAEQRKITRLRLEKLIHS